MAKQKEYFYKCIHPDWVEVGYMAYNKRGREIYRDPNAPERVKHVKRVRGENGIDGRGRPRPPDYVSTFKPIASHLLKGYHKKFSKPAYDRDGRIIPGKRRIVEKDVPARFEEVEEQEVRMRENREDLGDRFQVLLAKDYDWTPDLFDELPRNAIYRPDLYRADGTLRSDAGAVSPDATEPTEEDKVAVEE